MSVRPQNLAGAFRAYARPSYHGHERRILYIGKATMGAYEKDDAANKFDGRSSFWDFARSVSRVADPNCEDLSNLAWSNIFKQGVTTGNPIGELAESQRASAVIELRDEVRDLKPTLILLVNAGYYEEIPKSAYLIGPGEIEDDALMRTAVEGEDKWDLWSRAAYGEFPPIVWMYHPQGKRREYTAAALDLIRKVMGW